MSDSEKLDLILNQVGAMNERFDGVNKRFDEVDRRFEAVDKRFDEVDKRFEAVDKRFEAIDKRLEAVDKRFDEMDERFREVDERLGRLEEDDRALDVRLDVFEEKLADTRLYMENVLEHNIQLIAENHMSLVDKLNQAIRVSDKTILYEVQVSGLKMRLEKVEADVSEIKKQLVP